MSPFLWPWAAAAVGVIAINAAISIALIRDIREHRRSIRRSRERMAELDRQGVPR